MIKNQQDDVTKVNQTKELEKINAELAHNVAKLEKHNNYQYKGLLESDMSEEHAEQAKILLAKKRILSAKRAIADVETASDITGSSLRKLTKTHKELNLALEQLNLLSRELAE